ncbi:MAG: hypothetical protein Q4G55_08940, partial [bacterium]|nr:hypothetical protein [bacterium]
MVPQQPQVKDGESGLGFAFGTATGTNILRTISAVIPSSEISCDNVLARVRVYLQKQYFKSDLFQIVVSTNQWASYECIGEPIFLEDDGRTVNEWVTVERCSRIPGLSSCGEAISVGILAGAGYRTGRNGYLQSLELDFVATATPLDVGFETDGQIVASLQPGEAHARVAVTVDAYPMVGDGAVEVSRVYCVLDRNGVTNTLEMVQESSSMRWFSEELLPPIDAGELLKVSVCTEYTSATLGTLGEKDVQGVSREQSSWIHAAGTQKGSVWMNEFTPDKVELCGTTNRMFRSGWSLGLSDEEGTSYRADLPGVFDFTTNMVNGVIGLETRDLAWKSADGNVAVVFPPTNYVVRLYNAAGIVEHEIAVTLPLTGSVGMTGCAMWPTEGYEYDWTGTATSGVFSWGALSSSSFGMMNDGQGLKIPVEATLVVKTGMQVSDESVPLSYATVVATTHGLGNDTDTTTPVEFSAQSEDGVAVIKVKGYSTTPEKITLTLSANAFGWYGNPMRFNVRDKQEVETSLLLVPTIAEDDFSGMLLKDFWRNDGRPNWNIVQEGGENVLRLNTMSSSKGTASLKCSNFLSTRGRNHVSISFDF